MPTAANLYSQQGWIVNRIAESKSEFAAAVFSLADEVDLDFVRNDAGFIAHVEQ